MTTPQTTVFDYALEMAVSRGWMFWTSDCVRVGLIVVDSEKRTVAVNPASHTVTLDMNTRGPLLPGAYDDHPA